MAAVGGAGCGLELGVGVSFGEKKRKISKRPRGALTFVGGLRLL